MDCGDGDVKISGRMGMGMKLRDGVQMGKIHSDRLEWEKIHMKTCGWGQYIFPTIHSLLWK